MSSFTEDHLRGHCGGGCNVTCCVTYLLTACQALLSVGRLKQYYTQYKNIQHITKKLGEVLRVTC